MEETSHFFLGEVTDSGPKPTDDASKFRRIAVNDVMCLEVSDAVLAGTAQKQLERPYQQILLIYINNRGH